MKRIHLFSMLIVLSLLSAGCTTSSILGLSRASYIEELEQKQSDQWGDIQQNQETQIQEEMDILRREDDKKILEIQQNLADLQAGMEEVQFLSEQMDSLIVELNAAEQDTAELQLLAEGFKSRMETIHKETLTVLVSALEQYMDEMDQM